MDDAGLPDFLQAPKAAGLPPYVPYWNPQSFAEWQAMQRPATQSNPDLNYAGRFVAPPHPGSQFSLGLADPGWQMLRALGLAPSSVGI
jgi:hypothetical protein